jgi:hypothetical protein
MSFSMKFIISFQFYHCCCKNRSFNKSCIYTRNFLDMDCQTQGRLKLMIELYISEICHKFQ